jgi:hypothetical protein
VPIGEGSYRLRFSYRLQRWICARVCAAVFRNSAQRCSFPIGTSKNVEWLRPTPKNVEWLRSRMEQYRSITNDVREAIGEIDLECTRNLAAKGG